MQRWICRTVAAVMGKSIILGSFATAMVAVAVEAPANAQSMVKNVEPYVAVVTVDRAPMRGCDAPFYYPVKELKSGELLRANGEGPGWVRVEYPAGMRAYVHASDVEPAKDGKTVKLIRQSQLLAYDITPNAKAPWWPLDIEKALPSGTTLDIVSVSKGPDDVVQGYVVPAPAKARGYVAKDHVRKATPEEAAKLNGTIEGATKPIEPVPVQPAETTKPSDATVVPSDLNSLPPGFTPVTPVPAQVPVTPAVVEPVAPIPMARQVPPPPKKDEEIEQIRSMFDKTMASRDDGELATVIGLFDRKIAKLGNTPGDQSLRTQLTQRLEVLKLRQEIAAEAARVKDVGAQRDSRIIEVRLMVEQATKQAIYTIIGRIVPSAIYDGKRGLPVMFRIESPDSLAPRTVGYIVPTEGVDLITKLGKVCGIVGETRFDDSLGLNIVAPRRIDVLGVNSTTMSTSAPLTPAAPAANPDPQGTTPDVPVEPEK